MTPEVRGHIFEPFFTTKERCKGSGMGLVTGYGIVRQHGGFIHVYSEPKQGTLFHVYLPVLANAISESTREGGKISNPKNLHGTETILLAEDHDSIRELTRQSLTRLGYQVLAATAAQLLQQMPGLPILFTSGFSENANNAFAQVPGSHYLQEPYGPTS